MKNRQHRGNTDSLLRIPNARSEHAGELVRIVDYDPATHRCKVVRLSNGEPLEPDQQTEEKIDQKKAFEHSGNKVLKATDAINGPILEVTPEMASLRGNSDFGFFTYREGGANIIKGPLSIATEPHQVRLAGLSTLNPLITSGFASTIVTPIPTCVWALPTTSMIQPLLRDVLIAGTVLAACGSGL